jgi:hypothetical protein
MRKIDKTNTLATAFANATKPDDYDNRTFKNEYYHDVLMGLLYYQKGLCAYTEKRLLSKTQQEIEAFFANGKYQLKNSDDKFAKPCDIFADIEHFDSQIKKTNGWSWDNLFAVSDSVNRNIKRLKEPKFAKKCKQKGWESSNVMALLKPDKSDYQWNTYLEYNSSDHIFVAKADLDEELAEQIEAVLLVLGINCTPIREERVEWIETWLKEIKKGDNPVIKQFPTAFEFCKNLMNKTL